ncbi:MAG TPA: EsaB/YukD family protein [Tepidisphaeraceae bacterium]|nr:EsaB/YukD family protein [Tepidisphaeraceae bacterium]
MSMVTVEVWDATGNKRQVVELPDDVPINRVLTVLLERLRFPQHGPDGQLLSYKVHHRPSGRQMMDSQCLRDVGVRNDDVLRLQPEITAG